MTKIEKRLLLYSTNIVIEFAICIVFLLISKILDSWILYLVLLVVLISFLFDICRCFISIKAGKRTNFLLVLSFLIAALDILSTLFAVDFKFELFKTHESNMLFIRLLGDKNIYISIICLVLLKLIIHVLIVTSTKVAIVLTNERLIQPYELQDYTFQEYFWYLRSIRYITDPFDYFRNYPEEPLNQNLAFSIMASSRSEIIIFTLFYIIIVLNNIFAFIVNIIGVEPSTRFLLKMIIYGSFAILIVINPKYAFSDTKRKIMHMLSESL